MALRARIENLDRLRRKLARLPEEGRKAVSQSLEQNANELVAMQKRFAPRESGDLVASISWRWTQPGDMSAETRASIKGGQGLSLDVSAGGGDAFYARWVEFGVQDGSIAKQPFFFPAYRVNQRRFRARISRNLNRALKQLGQANV